MDNSMRDFEKEVREILAHLYTVEIAEEEAAGDAVAVAAFQAKRDALFRDLRAVEREREDFFWN
jgi:hypothetical protein